MDDFGFGGLVVFDDEGDFYGGWFLGGIGVKVVMSCLV